MQNHAISFLISGMFRIFQGSLYLNIKWRLQAPCCEVVSDIAPMGALALLVSVEGQGVLASPVRGRMGAVLTPELDGKFHERNKHQGRVTHINGFFAVWFSMVFNGFPPCAMFQALHRSPALICLNHDVKVSSIDSCRAQELLGVKVHHLMTRPQNATIFWNTTGTVSQLFLKLQWNYIT